MLPLSTFSPYSCYKSCGANSLFPVLFINATNPCFVLSMRQTPALLFPVSPVGFYWHECWTFLNN